MSTEPPRDDLVSVLQAHLDRMERRYVELAQSPYEGLTDDDLHDRAAHPAYEYATTEGQRKAWDDADKPPEGDGWELNITGRDPEAFERFDYHEERYWRRLRPDGPHGWEPPAEAVDGLRLMRSLRDIVALHHPDRDPCDAHDASYESIPCEVLEELAVGLGLKEEDAP